MRAKSAANRIVKKVFGDSQGSRWGVLILSYVTLLAASLVLSVVLLWPLLGPFSLILGTCGWLLVCGKLLPYFTFICGAVEGAVLTNLFSRELYTVKEGLNPRFPWEVLDDDENYRNLEIVSHEHPEAGEKAENFPTKDGPRMVAKWGFQYRPNIERLNKFIAVGDDVVNEGFTNMIHDILTSEIKKRTVDQAHAETDTIKQAVLDYFDNGTVKVTNRDGSVRKEGVRDHMEELYGIEVVGFWIADLDFEEEVQQARQLDYRVKKTKEAAKNLRSLDHLLDTKREEVKMRIRRMRKKNSQLTYAEARDEVFEEIIKENTSPTEQDAINNVLLVRGGENVSRHDQSVSGEGGQAVAAFIRSLGSHKN